MGIMVYSLLWGDAGFIPSTVVTQLRNKVLIGLL